MENTFIANLINKCGFDLEAHKNHVCDSGMWCEHGSCLSAWLYDNHMNFEDFYKPELFKYMDLRYSFVVNTMQYINAGSVICRRMVVNFEDLERIRTKCKNGTLNTDDIGIYFAEKGLECAHGYDGTFDNVYEINIEITITEQNQHIINTQQTIVSRMDYDNGDGEGEVQLFKNVSLNNAKMVLIKHFK